MFYHDKVASTTVRYNNSKSLCSQQNTFKIYQVKTDRTLRGKIDTFKYEWKH